VANGFIGLQKSERVYAALLQDCGCLLLGMNVLFFESLQLSAFQLAQIRFL
jgi:hypothetical protein